MSEEKKQEKNKNRQIIIETDGNEINIIKSEVAGRLEFIQILEEILNKIKI